MTELEKRARNLYVIAAAIIVYLLAGADLDKLAVLGIRAPAKFPIVFSWASVVALFWFWWRYHLSWLGQSVRARFRDEYLVKLHQRKPFVRHVEKSVDHEKILTSYSPGTGAPEITANGFVGYTETKERPRRQFIIGIKDLIYYAGGTNYKIAVDHFSDKRVIELKIPWWFHYIHSPGFYLWKAIREEGFANDRLPQFLFATAIFLILCKVFWADPAGLFGLLKNLTASASLTKPG